MHNSLEVVHNSKNGSGLHGGTPTRVGDTMYFVADDEGNTKTLNKLVDGQAVPISSGIHILYLGGDGTHLFATDFQKDDIYRLQEGGFEPFVKTPDPGKPIISGDHLYWTSYKRGGGWA